MSRVPELKRDEMSDEMGAVYDMILSTLGMGRVPREWPSFLHSPEGAERVYGLFRYLASSDPVPKSLKEIAILAIARECDDDFIWTYHENGARRAGISDSVIDALRDRRLPEDCTKEETATAKFAWQFLKDHKIDDETFDIVHRHLGDRGVVELTMLIGVYTSICLSITALEVELDEGMTSTLSH